MGELIDGWGEYIPHEEITEEECELADSGTEADKIAYYVPMEMREADRWHHWEYVDGAKVPFVVNRKDRRAKSNDPSTWTSYEKAWSGLTEDRRMAFELGDGFMGVDFDNAFDEDGIKMREWAWHIYKELHGKAYIEHSPSGTGFKATFFGMKPEGMRSRFPMDTNGGCVEVYDKTRFWTVTGECVTSRGNIRFNDVNIRKLVETIQGLELKKVEKDLVPVKEYRPGDFDEAGILAYLDSLGIVAKGSRNESLFQATGKVFAKTGLDAEKTRQYIIPWAKTKIMPPLDDAEIERTVLSAMRNGKLPAAHASDFDPNRGPKEIVDIDDIPVTINIDYESSQKKLRESDMAFPGFIADFMTVAKDISMDWLPRLAFAGAMSTLAAACGPKYQIDGSPLNLFMIGLAPSGAGKDVSRKLTYYTLYEAGLIDRLGPEDVSSAEGFITELSNNPGAVFMLDEVSEVFQSMNNPNSHMAKFAKMLKQAYSVSGQPSWRPNCRADSKRNLEVKFPCPTIYGTTTAKLFWSSFGPESVEDGLLGRLLIFEEPGYGKPTGKPYQKPRPTRALVEQISRVAAFNPAGGNLPGDVCKVDLPITGDARQVMDKFRSDVQMRSGSADQGNALWRRSLDKVSKLAGIACVSRAIDDPDGLVILPGDVDLAINLIKKLTREVIDSVQNRLVKSSDDHLRKKCLEAIVRRGRIPVNKISMYDGLSRRTRRDILSDLIESGQIRMVDINGVTYYTST